MKRQKGLVSFREWNTVLTCMFPSVQIEAVAAQCQWQFCSCPAPVHPRSRRRGGNSVGLPGCRDWTRGGEKYALQNPRRHLLEAEAFWAAPAAKGEPTSISDKLTQISSYLKLRKNKWGNGEEDFDLCCRRAPNLRDPSFPLLPNICLYSTKWIVHQVIVFLHYIHVIEPFKHTRIYKI